VKTLILHVFKKKKRLTFLQLVRKSEGENEEERGGSLTRGYRPQRPTGHRDEVVKAEKHISEEGIGRLYKESRKFYCKR